MVVYIYININIYIFCVDFLGFKLISNMNYTHGFTFVLSLCRRRAAQRGCQFGTCQVHNLASKLYRMGQSNGKDESKKANDPTGYGR
uniref:Adrenomedullin n=1 Tax=Sinocyclocheilus rhinocerous TaxID=307959 RepID=A0A673M9A8_9TELE